MQMAEKKNRISARTKKSDNWRIYLVFLSIFRSFHSSVALCAVLTLNTTISISSSVSAMCLLTSHSRFSKVSYGLEKEQYFHFQLSFLCHNSHWNTFSQTITCKAHSTSSLHSSTYAFFYLEWSIMQDGASHKQVLLPQVTKAYFYNYLITNFVLLCCSKVPHTTERPSMARTNGIVWSHACLRWNSHMICATRLSVGTALYRCGWRDTCTFGFTRKNSCDRVLNERLFHSMAQI